MSRIDNLISDLCPDWVEHKPLGSLCNVFNGFAFKSELFNTDGIGLPLIRIRDVNTGLSNTHYSGDYDDRYVVSDGDILIGMDGDFRAVRWQHGQALLNQRVCRLQGFTPEVLPTFIFYKVQDELDRIQTGTQGSTVKHLSSRELERARLPVPPLEVQREIVRILDHFTELEVELEARRRQYSFCSDLLLSRQHSGPLRRVLLRDAVSLVIDHRGKTPGKLGGDWVSDGHRVISALNIRNGKVDDNDHHYISETMYGKWMSQPLSAGDVLLTSEAPLGSVAFVEKDLGWAIGQRLFALRPRPEVLDGRFLYHLLRAGAPRRELLTRSTGSTVSGIRQAELVKVELALPAIVEQVRIASILDKFEALINDLSIGLPAELTARRKQYEHYRDRLLTFKELPA